MSSTVQMLAAVAAETADAGGIASALSFIDPVFLLLWAAALCGITAVVHSVLGEMRLIWPMLADKSGLMESPLARNLTRFAWHWTSLLWLLVGALLYAAAYGDILAPWLGIAVGAVHVVAGIADGALTRGRHIGWPLITLIGVFTLLSVYLTW